MEAYDTVLFYENMAISVDISGEMETIPQLLKSGNTFPCKKKDMNNFNDIIECKNILKQVAKNDAKDLEIPQTYSSFSKELGTFLRLELFYGIDLARN